jgi:hypothetical protein
MEEERTHALEVEEEKKKETEEGAEAQSRKTLMLQCIRGTHCTTSRFVRIAETDGNSRRRR